VNLSRIL